MGNELEIFFSYAIAVSLLTITPGVDTALIMQASFSKKKNSSLKAALGILLGCSTWGLLVALGLGALITSNEALYLTIKSLGAIYLIWLGVSALLRLMSKSKTDDKTSERVENFLAKGFLANILNPKVGLFYVSLLPQFIPEGANVVIHSFFLVSIHIILSAAWFWFIAKAVIKSRKSLQNKRVAAIVEALTGIVFIGFGIKLLATSK